jgi:hypothetical protein
LAQLVTGKVSTYYFAITDQIMHGSLDRQLLYKEFRLQLKMAPVSKKTSVYVKNMRL